MWIFWSIVCAVVAVQWVLNSTFEGESNNTSFGAVIIFFLVTGMVSLRGSLNLALGFGATRKEYIKSTILFYLAYSAVNSLIMVIFGIFEVTVLNNAHITLWFSMMDLATARPDYVWLIQTIVLFDVVMFFFMLSSLHLRFGIPAYISALVILAANVSLPAGRAIWTDMAFSFYEYENLLELLIGFAAAGIVFSLLTWLLLSRVSVKTAKV